MIIAIDVGGTKTLVTTFSSSGEMAENVVKFPTPLGIPEFIDEIKSLLGDVESKITNIVVGVPGIVKDGIVIECGNLPWRNFHLKSALEETYNCAVQIENDAKLAGLAEANSLKPVPDSCLYITIGTGIGSALILHGKLDPALSGSEAGHMELQTEEGLLEWENLASGRAIAVRYGTEASKISKDSQWKEIANDFSAGLQVLIPALQPNVVIIGGGIGQYFEKFEAHLKQILQKNLPAMIKLPPIKKATHPDLAVIYGCYFYVTHQKDN